MRKLIRIGAATKQGFLVPFLLIWRYRALLRQLVRRELKARTSGTVLGGLWLLVQPAFQMFGFWFLLGFVLQIRSPGRVSYVEYFVLGMTVWLMMVEILNRSLSVLQEQASLYQRAIFPIKLLPLVPQLLSIPIYALVLALIALLFEGPAAALLAPVIVLVLGVWLIPFVYLLAVLGIFFKDLGQIVPFAFQMLMYLTPILYMPEMLPESMRLMLVVNPMADIMSLVHAGMQGMAWEAGNLYRPLILWLLALGPSWFIYNRSELHVREML